MIKRSLAIRMARKFGISEEDAEKLVAADLDTPAKVKGAKDKDIKDAVGNEVLKKIRGK